MISYAPFWRTLKEKKVSTYYLIKKKKISAPIIHRMKNNEYISTRSVDDLCQILKCNVSDILEIILEDEPDANPEERIGQETN